MVTHAVVFEAANQVAVREVELPEPRPDEAVVRTIWSWISNGTEGSFLRGERADGETPSSPERPAPFPIVAGYQRVGVVEWAGPDAGVVAGQQVFATVTRLAGLATGHGGQVALGPVQAQQLYPLPSDGPPIEAYAGLVLTQVGYNCGSRPGVAAGEAVAVIGDGMVGQWAAQTLRARGCRVALLGRHESRLRRFAARPADLLVNSRETDAVEAVKAWSGGALAVIVDTVGCNPDVEALFWSLRKYGAIVSAGYLGEAGRIDIQMLRKREAALYAPSGWTRERMETTLAWVSDGRLDTLGLVSDRLPAGEAAEAWRRIRDERERTLGVLLDWRGM